MVAPVARARSKQIDIGGEMWKIERLNAYDGAYLGYILLNNALPPMVSQALGGNMEEVTSSGAPMSKAQFRQMMQDLLRVTAKKMPAGWIQEVIRFNFADFFTANGLLDSVGGLLGMSRQNTPE